MYETFLSICHVAINGMSVLKDLVESFDLLQEKISRRDREKIEEYILGESLKMKQTLSREHMLSAGVSEKYVDAVIEEIRIFLSKVTITDEIRSQCGYQNMELTDLLWREYCRLNSISSFEEYGHDLKKGLFVVAKAWNEPPEESIRSCIGLLQRIDGKSSKILLDVREVKNDTKDINRTVKGTERRLEKQADIIEKVSCTAEDTNDMVREMHQLVVAGKSGAVQTVGGQEEQKEYNPEGKEDASEDTGTITSDVSRSQQEDTGEEEHLPDEITICLAAALDEFQEDIDILQEFIEEQNNSQNDVHLKLQCCDGEVPQDLAKSKYCYILVGSVMEQWMQETYEAAYKLYSDKDQKDECVQLHVCFKKMPDGEKLQLSELKDGGREEWKNRYQQDFNRMPVTFHDMNRIKLDMLLHLRTKAPDVIFSTKSIIQFRNHPELEKAYRERDELQCQYKNDDQIKVTQKDIWNHLKLLTDKMQSESTMDAREAEAIEDIIEYGDYKRAEEILRSREWMEEIAAAERLMQEKKEVVRRFISSQRILISNLTTKGTSDEIKEQILEIYERITVLSKEWRVEYITMYEFVEFLLNWRKYEDGIKVGEELQYLYERSDCASTEERARLLKLLGSLYYNIGEYETGKKYYNEALQLLKNGSSDNLALRAEIYNDMIELAWKKKDYEEAERGLDINIPRLIKGAASNPDIYEPLLSNAYNYKAIIENRRNRLDEAVKYHLKALKIRKRLAGRSTSYDYQPLLKLTNTYNNLGFVYKKKGDYQKAEEYYMKAIRIRDEYAKRNPSVFLRSLALVYNNYALMLNERGDNEKAQEICEKSYLIRRSIVEKEPSYKMEFANTLYKYGIILTDAGEHMYPQAQKYFEEAIEIRKGLAKDDERTYGLELAETYCGYGKLLVRMGEFPFDAEYYEEAEINMQRACEKCDKYPAQNKGFDTDKTAEIYYSYAVLLSGRLHKYSEAEAYYHKAIEGYTYLTKQCPQAFRPKLKQAERKLAELRERM